MTEKFTDTEVVKALECCSNTLTGGCNKCPIGEGIEDGSCITTLCANALDLINRKFNEGYTKATREIAEKFEDELGEDFFNNYPFVLTALDNIVNDMIGNSEKIVK